ncbi:lecithin-cholesterol acyltransferase-like 1 [Phragmites australis]|uniref:lecithin-cholesterol acyltransferase-like 1 n=1 Tax=Phragmites australis TaxID=29695 RepID=UPI002D7974B9|nr:lecithin-cholesterol acyltransferase-like 1 [Phragmites australis]
MACTPTPLVRLLPLLLLLLLPSPVREYLSAASNRRPKDDVAAAAAALHPIVLVPGVSCSELEARLTEAYRPSVPRCGAMKGKGWFGLWANCSDLPAHDYVRCFQEQMSLVYDPDANDYRNLPGVETRVPNFGSTTGFQRNPVHTDWCLEILRHELERIGYRDGDTLFGAPYDLRHAPPVPGQPSQVYSRYFRQLMALVENASKKRRQHNKKVILFGHSFGGMVALEFVRGTPMAWRDKYIKHLVLVAPIPAAGFVQPVEYFISGTDMLYVPTATPLSMRPMWRSFESAIANFPSPAVFGRRPIVITKQRNYSAHDMEDLLAAVGFARGVEPFKKRELPRMRYFQAPMVPTTCINGVGSETAEQLVYWESDFDGPPEVVYGDGDNSINLISMLAFDEEMRQQPGQKRQFKSIKLHGAQHGSIVTDEWALKRVVQEILEANQI